MLQAAPAWADDICNSIRVGDLPSFTMRQAVEICRQMDQVLSGVTKGDVINMGMAVSLVLARYRLQRCSLFKHCGRLDRPSDYRRDPC
jgi:hypothetical protein